jgi:transcriptional regulator with XRE-family HTH domain
VIASERTTLIRRIGLAVSEARLEHRLSERQLSILSGVSRATIRKLEHGGRVRPDLAVRVAAAILVCDTYRPPYFEHEVPVLLSTAARGEWSS